MKPDLKTSDSSNIYECSASYYNPATKKWDFGWFTLTKDHVQFICNSESNAQFHLCLSLSTISRLEKRQSNFIYPSLVVSVSSEKHWFGSFSSRDAVYNLLELFWRDSLISNANPYRKYSPPLAHKTNSSLGKEILSILSTSKNTLIQTANALSDHSRQLYDAEEAVEDLKHDLSTVEAIKSSSLPLKLKKITNNNKGDIDKNTLMHKFKVTFSFSNDENKVHWEKGMLVISSDAMFLKVEENTLFQVTKDELEVLQVLSPWELCIIHNCSRFRNYCYFMCPQLSRLLKFVSCISHYQEKVVYIDDDSSVYDTASCSSFGSAGNSPSLSSTHSNSTHSHAEANSLIPSKEENQELNKIQPNSTQTEENNCTLPEEEIQEIKSILHNLQTLASEVGREQENQMKRINTLAENMENTEIRLKKENM